MSRRPLRVTLFLDSLGSGGAQRQALLLARHVNPSRVRVRVRWWFPDCFHDVSDLDAARVPREGKLDPRFLRGLRSVVSRRETDLVHAFLPTPSAYAAMAALLPGSAPVLAGVRCGSRTLDVLRFGGVTLLGSRLARHTTVNAQEAAEWLQSHGVPRSRITPLPNLLDPALLALRPDPHEVAGALAEYGLPPDARPIVCPARFDPWKKQDDLVRALGRLRAQGLRTPPLLCVGQMADASRVEAVRAAIREAGLTDTILAPATRKLALLVAASRVIVLPTMTEGFPNAVLEALAQAAVCVTTRVGESTVLVREGETGLLCVPGDVADLAAALERALVLDEDAARALGQRAREDVAARYDAYAVAARHADLYEQLAG